MKTRLSPWRMCAALALVLGLAGCGERAGSPPTAAPPAETALPTPPPAPATDQWVGKWNGPEGTYLEILGGQGHYDVTVRNLDGPRTFAGAGQNNTIVFERDGQQETLRATDGPQTGMKWLAEKKNCLTVRAGEGYCKD
ncbi:hypothetical protein [Hydrogenophaga sp. BPS33]|uniref:hypothetical protein n=1 Tax=Hydrogenophaga sp. BPS33 TaxID=2651974 RepID=UPI00131FEB1D|nr:hypothetical protein [Hydrogenophaga sp. BPS33]QHE83500.1 hypothetical protein F9K07_00715 [Hydrogenophaga sp. BPS33]